MSSTKLSADLKRRIACSWTVTEFREVGLAIVRADLPSGERKKILDYWLWSMHRFPLLSQELIKKGGKAEKWKAIVEEIDAVFGGKPPHQHSSH